MYLYILYLLIFKLLTIIGKDDVIQQHGLVVVIGGTEIYLPYGFISIITFFFSNLQ